MQSLSSATKPAIKSHSIDDILGIKAAIHAAAAAAAAAHAAHEAAASGAVGDSGPFRYNNCHINYLWTIKFNKKSSFLLSLNIGQA